MSTFKQLTKKGMLSSTATCNFREGEKPDGCWSLNDGNLSLGHVLCISYEASIEDLPKLIVDSFINKYNRKPNENDLEEIIKKITASMKIAITQGKL